MGRKPSNRPTKAEAVTVRLNPKAKFGLELSARRQRRTISAVVESFIEKGLEEDEAGIFSASTESILNEIWDPEECECFLNLAIHYPELMTHEEHLIWKAIRENPVFHKRAGILADEKDKYNLDAIREHWELLNDIAAGNKDFTALPAKQI
jgi:hypothetical protein